MEIVKEKMNSKRKNNLLNSIKDKFNSIKNNAFFKKRGKREIDYKLVEAIDFKNPIKTENLYESDFDRIISRRMEILSRDITSKTLEGADKESRKNIVLQNKDEEIAPIFVKNSKIYIKKEELKNNDWDISHPYEVKKTIREVSREIETNKVETLLELGISKYDLQKLDFIKEEIQYIIAEKGILSYEKAVILNTLTEKYNTIYEEMLIKNNDITKTKLSDYLMEVTSFNSLINNQKEYKSLSNLLETESLKYELRKIEEIHKALIELIYSKSLSKTKKQNYINDIITSLNSLEYENATQNFMNIVEMVKLNIIKTIEINGYHTLGNASQMYNAVRERKHSN